MVCYNPRATQDTRRKARMPQIYDNIDQSLLPALKRTLEHSQRADFCVGYFNLRGWKLIDHLVEPWSGADGSCCRLMIGMQGRPEELLRSALSLTGSANGLDNQAVLQLNREAAAEFREQLQLGAPTNADERDCAASAHSFARARSL